MVNTSALPDHVRRGAAPTAIPDDAPSRTPLGLPPAATVVGLQTDCVKELVNKIAWTLGSTYRAPYNSMRTPARAYAWRIVKTILEDHGYPAKIKRSE